MSKYNRFEDFMVEVVKTADNKCMSIHNVPLNDLYKVKSNTIVQAVLALISKGWGVFLFVTALLLLGPIAFGIGLGSMATNPVGWIALGVVSAFGGITVIRKMYQNKKLPLAIRETGQYFKPKYKSLLSETDSAINSRIESLVSEASDYLINKALQDE